MKTLNEYINNVDEAFIPIPMPILSPGDANFLPPEWRWIWPALYTFTLLCVPLGMFWDYIKGVVSNKLDQYKYKKELEQIKEILDKDEEYQLWLKDKHHKLKDLKPIILKLKNNGRVKDIIKDVWEESKQ